MTKRKKAETAESSTSAPGADIPDVVVARPSSLTPRDLAVVLNRERNTPHAGMMAISPTPMAQGAVPADAGSPAALAAGMRTSMPVPEVREERGVELLLFRIGGERYATALADVDEAVDLPEIHPIPEAPPQMLGVFELRGELLPVYAPASALGAHSEGSRAAAFVMHAGAQRIALAVDELDDVLQLTRDALRPASEQDAEDGVLAGVATIDGHVVAVVDGAALVTACLSAHLRSGTPGTAAATEAA